MKKPLRIINLVGARPQFIKASAISRLLKADERFEEVLVHSGQHYDKNMSDVFFKDLGIPKPKYNLGIKNNAEELVVDEIRKSFEKVLKSESPDAVVLYGDTYTTLGGALAASAMNIPVAHVEAGLRSFNPNMPEEFNRVQTDKVSTWLFCPTDSAIENLEKEGLGNSPGVRYVYRTGDIMLDVAQWSMKKQKTKLWESDEYAVFTLHRNFNTDNQKRLETILNGVMELSEAVEVVFPIHPRTAKNLTKRMRQDLDESNVWVIEPVAYPAMINLLSHSRFVVTDSGGLQKEAYFVQKPVMITRAETEWVEMLETGNAILVDDNAELMIRQALEWLDNPPSDYPSLYGNGNAASQIVESIYSHFTA
ncbi:MAG: UDP-N-acetylglucosamine 2-epimerase (non-hydrolyzing) [Flavobacteriia bacterium]|nr:UDP-N-acetylglucosamine 2-epimerase (non-hydrolyzing) [Flavobacteriia bacterium]